MPRGHFQDTFHTGVYPWLSTFFPTLCTCALRTENDKACDRCPAASRSVRALITRLRTTSIEAPPTPWDRSKALELSPRRVGLSR